MKEEKRKDQKRTEQNRTEQNRTEQNRTEQNRTEWCEGGDEMREENKVGKDRRGEMREVWNNR